MSKNNIFIDVESWIAYIYIYMYTLAQSKKLEGLSSRSITRTRKFS